MRKILPSKAGNSGGPVVDPLTGRMNLVHIISDIRVDCSGFVSFCIVLCLLPLVEITVDEAAMTV